MSVTPALHPVKAKAGVPLAPAPMSVRKSEHAEYPHSGHERHAPNPTRQNSLGATHIIHTPAAMFRGWTVMQLKRPETAQA